MTVALLSLAAETAATAQRATYPPEEFAERRARLCERLDGGAALLFSETMPRYGARFRQDHDFFYLTGHEGRNAVLLLEVDGCEARLYLPHQGDREKFIDGPNWLHAPEQAKGSGFEVDHLAYLPEHLARRRGRMGGRTASSSGCAWASAMNSTSPAARRASTSAGASRTPGAASRPSRPTRSRRSAAAIPTPSYAT